MGLFGFNKKAKEDKFPITEADRSWVEDNLKWLIRVFGYPDKQNNQILVTQEFFPKTFANNNITIQNLIIDLCELMDLDAGKIKFELHEDLRDTYGMPWAIQGALFEAQTEVVDDAYLIHIANSILKQPNRLIFSLIYEFINIRLAETKLPYDTGEDASVFIFIAGIYFGFGVPLSQNLMDIGVSSDGFWETSWVNGSEMPYEVMAYGLATYSILIEEGDPDWKDQLPHDLKVHFEGAVSLLHDSPSLLFNMKEFKANDLMHKADKEYEKGNFDSAIVMTEKVLSLTEDEMLKADALNNLGYSQSRIGEYDQSILNAQKALTIYPDFGYAYDNLGYALIQIGELEEGKIQLENALKTENNDLAYNFRNLALYHWAKNEIEAARSSFQSAFEAVTIPVDLLELDYANFLISQGEKSEGVEYLKKAVEKGDREAIERMNEIVG